jgi:hypothetical protein
MLVGVDSLLLEQWETEERPAVPNTQWRQLGTASLGKPRQF